MPVVESRIRIGYSNFCCRSAARIVDATAAIATAEPMSARTFRKRAKSSTTKLPPKADGLPAGSQQTSSAGDDQQHDRQPLTMLA